MRKIVLAMMTTLNGRLDDPMAWVHGVGDDQYTAIYQVYSTFDAILVGRITYEEFAAYWPGALTDKDGTEINRGMAKRMRDCKKLVFSRSGKHELTPWQNAEKVVVSSDADLGTYLQKLKVTDGGSIHLAGGASLAQDVIGLGLVDEFYFYVYPVVSSGKAWFSRLAGNLELDLIDAESYRNGVSRLHYSPKKTGRRAKPATFTNLLD
jgi:dihydrofolate reductase